MSSSLLAHKNAQLHARLLRRSWLFQSATTTHRAPSLQTLSLPPLEDPWLIPILDTIWDLSRSGYLFEAFHAYSWLRHRSPLPYLLSHSVSSILACSTEMRARLAGQQLHAHIISLGFLDSSPMVSRLVAFYAGCGSFDDAEAVAEDSDSGDSFTWNLLISAYVRVGFYWHALLAYESMNRRGVSPDNFTQSSVLKACSETLAMGFGRGVHARMVKCCFEKDLCVQNALVSLYAKCGELSAAEKLFVQMPVRDIVSWNALMTGYVVNGMWEDAYKFLERMRFEGMELNTVTWNIIIRANLLTGDPVGALQLVSQMRTKGCVLDSVTMAVGLTACSRIGCLNLGKEVHGLALRCFYGKDELVINSLITMYSRCSKIECAEILFQASFIRSSISWNCIMSGYLVTNRLMDALFLFKKMILSGHHPTYVTILIILSLCARIANLHHGKEIHCYILRNGFHNSVMLWNSLIDMYCKSGRILEAQNVFDSINDKDVFSYTIMMDGLRMQGEGHSAVKLLMNMTQFGIKPDHVTMVVALSACCHARLLKEGQQLFDNMALLYSIVPGVEHYSCMANLYVCTGSLSKAEELLKRMPIQQIAGCGLTCLGMS